MTLTARQPEVAAEMGKYHLVAELARGGMGNVYLAALCRPGGFNKLLVLKELKPEFSDDETYVAMFLEEARLAAHLIHPNIVQTNEVSSEDGRHYMTMEYLDGRSLSRIVRRFTTEGGFPIGAQLRVLADALLGLHHAHEMRGYDGEPLGIVHRDVSPLNVMVTFDGQVKVLDFGIAKSIDSSLETKAGILKGRVAYMAPEQAVGAKVDRRADLYSIGVMIWEAAAGRRLWPEMSEVEILSRILQEGPPRLRDIVPDAPADLDAICARAMARDSEDRYSTAMELHDAIEVHLAGRADRMATRQIGALVGRVFADERRQMNQVIEEAIARVGRGPRSGVMPAIRIEGGGTPSGRQQFRGESGSISGAIVIVPGSSTASSLGNESSSRSSVRGAFLSESEVHSQSDMADPIATSHRNSRPRGLARAAGAVVFLLLAVGVGAMLTGSFRRAPQERTGPVSTELQAPTATNLTASAPQVQLPAIPVAATVLPPKTELREIAKAPPVLPVSALQKSHWTGKTPAPPPSPAPALAPDTHRAPSPPAAQAQPGCDPPYTIDSNGIEHFKAGCL